MAGPVAIATCRVIPEPDSDQDLLLAALAAAGVEAQLTAWDDPAVSWGGFSVVIIRSTWNYFQDVVAFRDWATRVEAVTQLFNPAEVIRWNTHKGYLRALADAGIPIVPTTFVDRGARISLADLMRSAGWTDVVAKPQVSASSYRTDRVRAADLPGAERQWADLVQERDAMVQPYMTSVEDYGERSLIWIDGALTHAIRKGPRLGGGDEAVSEALPIARDERALAEHLVGSVPQGLLYARVDLVRDDRGTPCVMELELVEPSLYLKQSPEALERLVAAVQSLAQRPAR